MCLDSSPLNHRLHSPNNRQAPIGVFDSGVGGLSVWMQLKNRLAHEQGLYLADTLNVPYGERSAKTIESLTTQAVSWLLDRNCKLIVVACNSASAHALDQVRQRYPHVPIVGLVPALKPALLATQSNKVAVLATQATIQGGLLQQVLQQYGKHSQVDLHFDAELVPWVEAGMPKTHHVAMRLLEQVDIWHNKGVDHLVLGCTHYPFFKSHIQDHLVQNNMSMRVLDSGVAVACRVEAVLKEKNLLRQDTSAATWNFYATQPSARLNELATKLLSDCVTWQLAKFPASIPACAS